MIAVGQLLWITIAITCCSLCQSSPGSSKATYIHHVRIKDPPPSASYKSNPDLLLIKHLAHTHNRHNNHHHQHQHHQHHHQNSYKPPTRTRNKRRPKPVYGPPPPSSSSSSIKSHFNDQHDDDSYDESPPIISSQHTSFAEPPADKGFPPLSSYQSPQQPTYSNPHADDQPDYNSPQLQYEPVAAAPAPIPSVHKLPIEPNANGYMLPPSTSYGVPVSPIINVYPDKLEYLHQNPQPASTSLYSILQSLQPNTASAAEPDNPVSSNVPHLHFAEPLPDYQPAGKKFGPTAPVPIRFRVHDQPSRPNNSPPRFAAEDQYDDINNDDNTDFRPSVADAKDPPFSANSKASHDFGSNHRYSSFPNFQSPSPVDADQVPRSHILDTVELRDAFAGGEKRSFGTQRAELLVLRTTAPKSPPPAASRAAKGPRFGQRIPKVRVTSNLNNSQLPAASTTRATTTTRPAITTAAANQPETETEPETTTFPVLVLLSAQNDASGAEAAPIPSKLTRPNKRESPLPRANSTQQTRGTTARGGKQLRKAQLPKIFDDPRVEIISVEQSRSHSFYAGTMAPPAAIEK